MSFLFWPALFVALAVAAPIAAHLLRQGRARVERFAAVKLVTARAPTARDRRKVRDPGLLFVRAASVLLLALLGATPLVRCDRVTLERHSGASVGIAIVLDDASSMRAPYGGESRFTRAKRAALELLAGAREGDSFALVLAGKPARLEVPATSDLSALRAAIDATTAADRGSDVSGAVALARAAVDALPHTDKRVVVLSDLTAPGPVPSGAVPLHAPLRELAKRTPNCAVVSAELAGRAVQGRVVCSEERVAGGRTLRLFAGSQELASEPLGRRVGEQTVRLTPKTEPKGALELRLDASPVDGLPVDDTLAVAPEGQALSVAVLVDPTAPTARNGGATLLEQALGALERRLKVTPLTLAPDDDHALDERALLLLDDPIGLGPAQRTAIERWARRGGVAVAFLGPNATRAELASTLSPFARGAVRWEPTAPNVDLSSATELGPEAASLSDLRAKGRAVLDTAAPDGSVTTLRWADGRPLAYEQRVDRGLLVTVGLPTSPERSELPLRPALLALLDGWLEKAAAARGARVVEPGARWPLESAVREVLGPDGRPLPSRAGKGEQRFVEPALAGRYRFEREGASEERFVARDAQEPLHEPLDLGPRAVVTGTAELPPIDVSRELALGLLGLLAAELGLRLWSRWRATAASPGASASPTS